MATITDAQQGHLPDKLHSLALDIVSDTICPWCFVGKRRLDSAIEELEKDGYSVTLTWRPYELNPDMPVAGKPRKAYRAAKFGSLEKSQQLDAGVIEASADTDIAWNYDAMEKTPNTFLSHRLIRAAFDDGGPIAQGKVVEGLFSAYFEQGRDVGNIDVLIDIGREAGLPHSVARKRLTNEGTARDIRTEIAVADRAGVAGVPNILMGHKQLFAGAPPPGAALAALMREATMKDGNLYSDSIYRS